MVPTTTANTLFETPTPIMVLDTLRRSLRRSSSRSASPAPSVSAAHSSRPTKPHNMPTTKSLPSSPSRPSLSSRTPKEAKISPYHMRAPVAPSADMSPVTIRTGTLTFEHPRALLEHGSSAISRQLMAEGIATDLVLDIPACLEPSAVKSAFDILISKNGGWELNIKAPDTRAVLSPVNSKRMKQSRSSSSSRSTKSSSSTGSSRFASEREASLWYIQLFEVGRYLNSEAVRNIALSGYRRGRRSLCVRSHIYRDIDYLNERELWTTQLGDFVVSMLAFEAKSEEELPEWIEQLLEDAPYDTFEAVKKQWESVSVMQRRGAAGWEDWVDPCVAVACLWHDHKVTRTCVDKEEKIRMRGKVERLSAPTRSRTRNY